MEHLWEVHVNRKIAGLLFLSMSLGVFAPSLESQEAPARQPVAPMRPVTDDYFGTKIVDNYRYFEDLKNPAVQNWMKAQADYTRHTLDSLPGYPALLKRVDELECMRAAMRSGGASMTLASIASVVCFWRKVQNRKH